MRAEKQLMLQEIKEQITDVKGLLVVRYGALTSNLANSLRCSIRKTGGRFRVLPKRLLKRAAEAEKVSLNGVPLDGHIGVIVTGSDAVQTTKAVVQFGTENPDMIAILGGQLEGVVFGSAEVDYISKLPSLDEMRAQLLGLFEAPMAQTLAVMEALLTSVMWCLENKANEES